MNMFKTLLENERPKPVKMKGSVPAYATKAEAMAASRAESRHSDGTILIVKSKSDGLYQTVHEEAYFRWDMATRDCYDIIGKF